MRLARRARVVALSLVAVSVVPECSRAAANELAGGGATHTVVRDAGGGVWTAGGNGNGQLGDGSVQTRRTHVLVQTSAVDVAAGMYHTIAVDGGGLVWSWGYNASGQVGDGTQFDRHTPVVVGALSNVVAVAAGGLHSLALTQSGVVYAWGANGSGQLGDGTSTTRITPTAVAGLTDVVQIAAARDHSLALKSDGTVWAWGENNLGQLGDSTTTARLTPVRVGTLTDVTEIAAGGSHGLARRADGTVWSWGANAGGQLGDGTTTTRLSPAAMLGATTIASVAAGDAFSVVRRVDETVATCGSNVDGAQGNGTTGASVLTLTSVAGLAGITRIGAGMRQVFAATADGTLYGWGGSGGLGDGADHDLLSPALLAGAGGVWLTGRPVLSPDGGTYSAVQPVTLTSTTPGSTIYYTIDGTMPTLSSASVASGGTVGADRSRTLRAFAVAAGQPASLETSATYTLVLPAPVVTPPTGTLTSPTMMTVTEAVFPADVRVTQNGTEPTDTSPLYDAPVPIATTQTVKVKAFRDGWTPSSTVTRTYTLIYGTLDAPTVAPAGGTYSSDQTVSLQGPAGATLRYTTNGSTPTTSSALYTGPFPVSASTTVKARAFHPDWTASATSTATYTLAVATPTLSLPSGSYAPGQAVTIQCDTPGATLRYALDGSTPTTSSLPWTSGAALPLAEVTVTVAAWKTGYAASAPASATYTLTGAFTPGAVAAGTSHTIVLRADGTVWAAGDNSSGQLGDGTTTRRTTPAAVAGLTGVLRSVAAGSYFSLAVRADGTVVAWGANAQGQLGDGTQIARSNPTLVPGLSGIVAVAAGELHGVALTSVGQVWTWGANTQGQLGDGTTTRRLSPVVVPGLTDIVAIGAGATHTLAVHADGTVSGWGLNTYGQLGDGTTTRRLSPVLVSGLTLVTQVAGGTRHSVARTGTGQVWTWGANTAGQLGDGTTTYRTAPVLIPAVAGAARVAGGDAHTLVVLDNGQVQAWGDNPSGQLGDGTVTRRLVPVSVTAVPAAVTVAGGALHSVALGPDDSVWTWGANAQGQLGDGTQTSVSTPAPIAGPDFTWGVVAPGLSPGGGTYHAAQAVTMSTPTPGAAIHYTTEDREPTTADPMFTAGVPLPVLVPTTVRARAWKTGLAPSPVTPAVYTLQPAAPTIAPGTGTYTTPQPLTLATETPGAIVRYTLDGRVPDESSLPYTSPLTLSNTLTVAARAFTADWAPSAVTSATLTFHYGVLTPPVADPAGGRYTAAQTVTLTADPGATIRYTWDPDLDLPTSSWSVYAAPLDVPASGTLRAVAERIDWTTSGVLTASYTIDATPPTISAVVSPAPNAAGWNFTPVTVSYVCTHADSCPEAVEMASEGADQVLTRSATSGTLAPATDTRTLAIDLTPPVLAVTSPLEAAVTTSAPSLTLTGTASDTLSGIAAVTCNGVAAARDADAWSCEVPLPPGRTAVVVHALDIAGSQASVGVMVTRTGTPTTLRITPDQRTLLVGESVSAAVTDNLGVAVDGATWSSSDEAVVSTSETQPFRIVARAPGVAIVTATNAGLSGSATITVVASTSMLAGLTRWRLLPSPDAVTVGAIVAQAVEPMGPELFVVEKISSQQAEADYRVWAVRATGQPLWVEAAPGKPVLADVRGGLVATVSSSGGTLVTGLARFAAPVGDVPWRYTTAEGAWIWTGQFRANGDPEVGVAQAPDGTVAFVETSDHSNELVALDGATGAVVSRWSIPRSAYRYADQDSLFPGLASAPVVGEDGALYVAFEVHETVVGEISDSLKASLFLARRDPAGPVTTQELWTDRSVCDQRSGDCDDGTFVARPTVLHLLPDGRAGLLVTWMGGRVSAVTHEVAHLNVARVVAGTVQHFAMPGQHSDVVAIGEGGTAYVDPSRNSEPGRIYAVDVETWATLWTSAVDGTFVAATDGGALLRDASNTLRMVQQGLTLWSQPAISETGQLWRGAWVDVGAESVVSAMLPEAVGDTTFFEATAGNEHGQRAPRHICVTCLKSYVPPEGHGPISPPDDMRRILSVTVDASWNVTSGETHPRVWNAAACAVQMWNLAMDDYGNRTGYYFVLDQDGTFGVPDIRIKKAPCYSDDQTELLACLEPISFTTPSILKLNEKNVSGAYPAIRDEDLCGRMAHEFAHKIGVHGGRGCHKWTTIMALIEPSGRRPTNSVMPFDVEAANDALSRPSTCAGTTADATEGIRVERAGGTRGPKVPTPELPWMTGPVCTSKQGARHVK